MAAMRVTAEAPPENDEARGEASSIGTAADSPNTTLAPTTRQRKGRWEVRTKRITTGSPVKFSTHDDEDEARATARRIVQLGGIAFVCEVTR